MSFFSVQKLRQKPHPEHRVLHWSLGVGGVHLLVCDFEGIWIAKISTKSIPCVSASLSFYWPNKQDSEWCWFKPEEKEAREPGCISHLQRRDRRRCLFLSIIDTSLWSPDNLSFNPTGSVLEPNFALRNNWQPSVWEADPLCVRRTLLPLACESCSNKSSLVPFRSG